ncbi:MAG TPA: hypothetical protein VF297_05155 [Pyrinomonadaceae bacterium]
MRLRIRLRILREELAWRYDRAVWPLRHRWACFKEKWPLMLLSTHAEQVKALDERLKRREREIKNLRASREPWPDVIEV